MVYLLPTYHYRIPSDNSLQSAIHQCVENLKCQGEVHEMENSVVTANHSETTFLCVLQTKAQQEQYGNSMTLMDGIYRTTKYGFPCIFLTVKTAIGSGRVVATVIPQHESEDLLIEGLNILKEWNPTWSPKFTMTDKSAVELGAIGQVFPSAIRLLCDFHRSQAWERWVSKNANDVLAQDRDTVLAHLKKLAYALTGVSLHVSV